MEGKTGRTKGKENTCRTVGITKALADSGHSTARKGFFNFFALKFGYSIETKNPNASPIRKVFGLFVCGRSDRIRTCGILLPKQARYQLRYTPKNINGLCLSTRGLLCSPSPVAWSPRVACRLAPAALRLAAYRYVKTPHRGVFTCSPKAGALPTALHPVCVCLASYLVLLS